MSASNPLHATLIAHYAKADWRGVLLRGPSGSGKSSLALRAMTAGFRLVADDRVILWTSGNEVFGRAPEVLAGLIEVRGLDVVQAAPRLRLTKIRLVADLVADPTAVDRSPDPETVELSGVVLPCITLAPFEAAAPQVLLAALAALQRPL